MEDAQGTDADFDTSRDFDTFPEVTAAGPWGAQEFIPRAFSGQVSACGSINLSMPGTDDSFLSPPDSRTRKNRSRLLAGNSPDGSGRCASAPLLFAPNSNQASTWYTSSPEKSNERRSGRTLWKPLASTWRDWDSDEYGATRANVDDGSTFRDGCIPHWGKGSVVRKMKDLEHEMSTAYLRMRRHKTHPCRKEVGDPLLPKDSVVVQMRGGRDKVFQFWRDLRPPFMVMDCKKIQCDVFAGRHPDGALYSVTYECGIDFLHERMWNTKSDTGTFDNRVHGEAKVRIPDGYPRHRPIIVLNWGEPKLNWIPRDDLDEEGNPGRGTVFIDPSTWMPISHELEQKANHPRFAACRVATQRANSKHGLKTHALQKELLGGCTSLPKLASLAAHEDDVVPPKKDGKARHHRIFTAAAGFVTYAG